MSEDITFCYNMKCQNKKCKRHVANIKQFYVYRSYGFFKDCEWWNLPEKYFTASEEGEIEGFQGHNK